MSLWKRKAESTPESAANRLALEIGAAFSQTQYVQLFGDLGLAHGWTLNDSLAVWHSLGNLALVAATWTAYGDPTRANRIIVHARRILEELWRMPDEVLRKLCDVVAVSEASALTAFRSCTNGADLSLFFSRYASWVLGAKVPPTGGSRFEDDMAGIRYASEDPILAAFLCRTFIDSCSTSMEIPRRSEIDWNSQPPA